MCTNFALGNISSSRRMRAVWGGDFSTSRRLYFHVSFLRKISKAARHSAVSCGGTFRKLKYLPKCFRRRGKIHPMHGDIKLAVQRANSSSCGDASDHSTLSIGRRFGTKKESMRESVASVDRNVCGNA